MPGETFDFAPDVREPGLHERTLRGRFYLHPAVTANPARPSPVLVFMHGLNREKVAFRFMGRPSDPDVREMVASLMDGGQIEPSILVAPTITDECDTPRTMWPGFDLDRFYALAVRALGSRATMDPRRVLLIGHSGAGCNTSGGMLTAVRSAVELRAVLVIDTCMDVAAAPVLALAAPDTDVVVSWQPHGWQRPFQDFERVFGRESTARHARGLRLVERMPIAEQNAHNAIVQAALARWLPRWIGVRQTHVGANGGGAREIIE